MVKKMMVGLLIAMVGVCFADYKSEFYFNLNDSAKIDKLLAEATAAKDKGYIRLYSNLKLIAGKDANTISYEEFKKMINNDQYKINVPQIALQVSRFNKFILNVVNDSEFNTEKGYVKTFYPEATKVMKTLGIKTWREKFLNIDLLKNIKNIKRANRIFHNYQSNSGSLSAIEIKTDCAVFKRAWYMNMTSSEEWKKLLVQIELMIKSVE